MILFLSPIFSSCLHFYHMIIFIGIIANLLLSSLNHVSQCLHSSNFSISPRLCYSGIPGLHTTGCCRIIYSLGLLFSLVFNSSIALQSISFKLVSQCHLKTKLPIMAAAHQSYLYFCVGATFILCAVEPKRYGITHSFVSHSM